MPYAAKDFGTAAFFRNVNRMADEARL